MRWFALETPRGRWMLPRSELGRTSDERVVIGA
jgi:hypothetical protein